MISQISILSYRICIVLTLALSTLTLDVDLVLLKFGILLEESLFCVNTREYICTLVELLSAYEKVKPNRIHHTVKIYMFALVFLGGTFGPI